MLTSKASLFADWDIENFPKHETQSLSIENVITKGDFMSIWFGYAGREQQEQFDLLLCLGGLNPSFCAQATWNFSPVPLQTRPWIQELEGRWLRWTEPISLCWYSVFQSKITPCKMQTSLSQRFFFSRDVYASVLFFLVPSLANRLFFSISKRVAGFCRHYVKNFWESCSFKIHHASYIMKNGRLVFWMNKIFRMIVVFSLAFY